MYCQKTYKGVPLIPPVIEGWATLMCRWVGGCWLGVGGGWRTVFGEVWEKEHFHHRDTDKILLIYIDHHQHEMNCGNMVVWRPISLNRRLIALLYTYRMCLHQYLIIIIIICWKVPVLLLYHFTNQQFHFWAF